jgi:CheY-like chemotaxis protein
MVRKNLDLQGWRILIVDNNEVYILFSKMYLERCGAIVEVSDNGNEALDLVTKTAYNVVIYNLEIIGLSGFEMLESLKSRGIYTPIIGVSAQDYRGRAIKAGLAGIVNRENQLVEVPEIIHNLKMAVPI